MDEQWDTGGHDDMLAWCFLPRDSRWRRGDQYGDRLLIAPGKTFHAADISEMRRRHFDAWERSLDALNHAPGLLACRVRLSGSIEREGYPRYYIVRGGGRVTTRRGGYHDLPRMYEGVGRTERLYASEFRVVWTCDATLILHHFACDVAERALRGERAAGREPDRRAWAMVAARRDWLAGRLADEGLQAAWSAFDMAMRESNEKCPPMPRSRLMTDSEGHDLAVWGVHANALSAVRYATEPVPFAAWPSVRNVKVTIGGTAMRAMRGVLARGEGQERRIAIQSAEDEAINAELGNLLLNAFAAHPDTGRFV